MRDKGTDFDRDMTRLEAEIKKLETEYNLFFAGRLRRLPWETRTRVEQLVKRYDRMNLSNTAQRFRFSTVQARFMSFCELWERNLRAKEEGGPVARGRAPAPPPVAAAAAASSPEPPTVPHSEIAATGSPEAERLAVPAAAARQPDPSPRPVDPPPLAVALPQIPIPPPAEAPRQAARTPMDSTRIGDVGRDSDRVSQLYDELTRARQAAGESPMPFDRFASVVKAQLSKLGGGQSGVEFRVNVSQGKVTLMARKAEPSNESA